MVLMPPFRRFFDDRAPMMRCWHCPTGVVDYNDTLGLCPLCIAELRDPNYVRELKAYTRPERNLEGSADEG